MGTEHAGDCGDDPSAMREYPARESKNRDRDGGGARKRGGQSEKDGAAERVVETAERRTGQPGVEQFHRRDGERGQQHRSADEERRAAPARRRRRRKRPIGRGIAAKPQAAQRDRDGDQGDERDADPARVVAGNVVVARMCDQIVGDDVNRAVRQHRRGCGGGDDQCYERAKSGRHWPVHSRPLPLRPRAFRRRRAGSRCFRSSRR